MHRWVVVTTFMLVGCHLELYHLRKCDLRCFASQALGVAETGRSVSPRSFNFSEQPAAKGLVDLKSECEPRQAIVQQSVSKDVAVRIDNSAWHPRVVSPSLSEAAAGFVSRVTAAEGRACDWRGSKELSEVAEVASGQQTISRRGYAVCVAPLIRRVF